MNEVLQAHLGGFPRLRVALAFLTAAAAFAQEPVRRYDLAGGEATDALREFARASGLQLLFPERALRGTQLPPLHGEFAADEALKRLLAESELEAVRDPATGAYAVRRHAAVPSRDEVWASAKRARAPAIDPTREPPLELSPIRVAQRRDLGVTTQSILRADRGAPLYHHVALRDDIEQSGVTTMAEFVTTLPGYSGDGAEALQATADLTFAGGANIYAGSFLKLRGWDAQHTTVLLNGRRLPVSPESRGPDLSRIPLAAVERVEVMPFAGSAIYGDGAVGGAMNIVLRKDFAGQTFSLQIGDSARGGGGEMFFTWIEGLASASGRTKATLIGDYQRREILRLGDRNFLERAVSRLPPERLLPSGTAQPDLRGGLAAMLTGYPSVFAVTESTVDLGIPARPGARFAVVPAETHAAQLPLRASIETDPTQLAARRQERVVLRRPTESFNLSAQLEHAVTPETFELYAELGYARADERFSAPDAIEPLTLSPVDLRNPFRNDPARGVFDRRVKLYFDPFDLPDARFRQMRDSVRAVIGARGVVGQSWQWVIDGVVDWSQSRASVRSYGASLNDLTGTWTPFRAPALVPVYDPLADHRTDPIAADVRERYLARDAALDYRSRLSGAEFRMGGKVLKLPAGPLRMALGAEYGWRDLVTRQQVTASAELYAMLAALNANGTNGVAADTFATLTKPWTREDRGERTGANVEAILPLLDGKKQRVPLQSVELNVASRAGRTDGGSPAASSLAALKVAPSASWALRGTISQGHVTPDSALVHDPVVETMMTASARDPRRGGVPQLYTLKTIRGGSAAVRAETSQARVAGVLFTPAAAPGLFASIDAWSITMRDRLRVPTLQEMVDHEAFFPGRVARGEPQAWESLLGWAGPVTSVDQRPVQATSLRAGGVDMEVRYRLRPTQAGTFTLTGRLEVVRRYEEQLLPVTATVDKVGVVVADASSGLMESAVVSPRGRAGLGWQRGGWHALVGMNYTPRYRTETTTPASVFPAATGLAHEFIGSSICWDFQVSCAILSGRAAAIRRWFFDTSWTLGVRNVFDREPPYRSDATSFYSRFDDPRMRFVYVRAQWRR